MDNLSVYEQSREVPENAKKTIGAGRTKGFTDINPMWRIKKLTELFGPCGIGWYYIPTKQWIEAVDKEICAFVNIELFVKHGGDWSKPIFGTGGSKLSTVERSGVYVSDECYKMATTDAISVACKQLGIGADVYWEKDKTKYDAKAESPTQPQETEPATATYVMSDTDKSALIGYMKKNQISIQKVCEKYQVQYLEQLSIGNVKAIMNVKNLGYFQQECGI